jgi:hypothetical protein
MRRTRKVKRISRRRTNRVKRSRIKRSKRTKRKSRMKRGGVLPSHFLAQSRPFEETDPCRECHQCIYFGEEFCTNRAKEYSGAVREIPITESTKNTFATYVKTPVSDEVRTEKHKDYVKNREFDYIIYSSDTKTLNLLNFDCSDRGPLCSGHSSFPNIDYNAQQLLRKEWFESLSDSDKRNKNVGLKGPATTKEHIVYYAGEVKFDENGNINKWNNNSGHYTPHWEQGEEVSSETGLDYNLFVQYNIVDGAARAAHIGMAPPARTHAVAATVQPEGVLVQVKVPPGLAAGQQFQIDLRGSQYQVRVPPGNEPGQVFFTRILV